MDHTINRALLFPQLSSSLKKQTFIFIGQYSNLQIQFKWTSEILLA